jgi:hypothetical protein
MEPRITTHRPTIDPNEVPREVQLYHGGSLLGFNYSTARNFTPYARANQIALGAQKWPFRPDPAQIWEASDRNWRSAGFLTPVPGLLNRSSTKYPIGGPKQAGAQDPLRSRCRRPKRQGELRSGSRTLPAQSIAIIDTAREAFNYDGPAKSSPHARPEMPIWPRKWLKCHR